MNNDQYDVNEAQAKRTEPKVTTERVYDMLFSQRFTEWYLTRFEAHVGGGEDAPSKNEILKDLKRLLC